jgi:hypothetical protein
MDKPALAPSGPQRAVGGCGCLFFAAFAAIGGSVFAAGLATAFWPEWKAQNRYVENTCLVLGKRLGESRGDDGATYRPEIHVRHSVLGRDYEAWTYDAAGVYTSGRSSSEAILDRFAVGQKYPCWYDPEDPGRVVLKRGYTFFTWFMLGLPLLFVAIGVGGMGHSIYRWRHPAESRTGGPTPARAFQLARIMIANRKQSPERQAMAVSGLMEESGMTPGRAEDAGLEYGNLPEVKTSAEPATALRVRLRGGDSMTLLGLGLFMLIWNGITWALAGFAIRGHLLGKGEWILTIFLIPFVLVGLLVVFAFIRQLLVSLGVGPTVVEVSAHPFRAGGQYDVHVSQSGQLTMNALRVLLVCEEKATYRQGTDTRTETRKVVEEEVYRNEGFEVMQGIPFEARFSVRIPGASMHSFESRHNAVSWRLVVVGDIANWPDIERQYPILLMPADVGEGQS